MTRETYAEMTLVDLKNKAKELGIKNISKLKKNDLASLGDHVAYMVGDLGIGDQ